MLLVRWSDQSAMPYTCTYNAEAGRFDNRYFGRVTGDEVVQQYLEMLHSKHWRQGTPRLTVVEQGADLSEITMEVFQEKFIPVIRDTASLHGPPSKIAWVFEDGMTKILGTLWQTVAEGGVENFRAFDTREHALLWLEAEDALA